MDTPLKAFTVWSKKNNDVIIIIAERLSDAVNILQTTEGLTLNADDYIIGGSLNLKKGAYLVTTIVK